jgi:arylsulfatase A-like enzyme
VGWGIFEDPIETLGRRGRGMSAPFSVVLVTVDCLRADHVSFLGYERPTTPFLASLAQESFVVPNTIVGGVPTYYSFPAILASRPPLAMGRDVVGITPGETTLATWFKQCGYSTAGFVAANPYVSSKFGYDQGFDKFQDFLDQPIGAGSRGVRTKMNRALERFCRGFKPLGAVYDELYFRYCQRVAPQVSSVDSLRQYPAADVVVDSALKWLASIGSDPFFLWIHLMDPHGPYYPGEAALRSFGARTSSPSRQRYLNSFWNRSDIGPNRLRLKRDSVLDLYDAGIRWVDMQMARLVDSLRSLDLWNRCALAFTADHGEEFLEHGGRFHAPGTMKEELIRVPLLVRIPDLPGGRMSRQPFSHLDFAPTLLEALSLQVPDSFRGRSRWREWSNGDDRELVAIVESAECVNPNRSEERLAPRVLCIRSERYKLVLHFAQDTMELFDLYEDPAEKQPLPDHVEANTRRRLLEYARQHIENNSMPRASKFWLRARLRELRFYLPEAASASSLN